MKEMGDGDYHPLPGGRGDAESVADPATTAHAAAVASTRTSVRRRPRLASLDAFRGLSIAVRSSLSFRTPLTFGPSSEQISKTIDLY